MARRQVLEIICDRCERVETQTLESSPNKEEGGKEMIIALHGERVEYGDLCQKCRKTLKNYFNLVTIQKQELQQEINESSPQKSGILGIGGRKAG